MAEAFGPYSHWRRAGDLVVISGQLGVVPGHDKPTMIEGGAPEQLRQALVNARSVLAEAGATFDQVVKATLFITDMAGFGACNEGGREGVEPPRAPRSVAARPAPLVQRSPSRNSPWAHSPKLNSGPTRPSTRPSIRSATCRTCSPLSAPSGSGVRALRPTSRADVARARPPFVHRRSTRNPTPD